jgi:hypothetical protein
MAVVNEQCYNAKQHTNGKGRNSNPLTKVKADKRSTHTE